MSVNPQNSANTSSQNDTKIQKQKRMC